MNFHILTPEFQYYAFFIIVTWCLGSSNLASHVYSRYFANRVINPFVIQCVMKGGICLVVMSVLPIQPLFSAVIGLQLASIPFGWMMGWCVSRLELIMNRFVQRRNKKRLMSQNRYYFRTGPVNSILSLAPAFCARRRSHLKNLHEHYAVHESKRCSFSLTIILSIALFEEMLFRGYLVQCCHFLPPALSKTMLVMTVIIFGISHASFGLGQIISKTILGGCCMVAVLVFHSLLPAFIIHGYLNWVAFRYQDRGCV